MKVLSRKSSLDRLLETLENQQMLKAAARHAIESAVAGATNPEQPRKSAPLPLRIASTPIKKVGKPTLAVAAGVAGVTAASAAVSSRRKRQGSA